MSSMVPVTQGGGLNERQRLYVDAIVSGLSDSEALKVAGYPSAARSDHVRASPAVQAAIRAGHRGYIAGELSTKARKTMEGLLADTVPAATRFAAAKWVLEQGEGQDDDDATPLHQMTAPQLEAFMARAQAVIDGGGEHPVIDVTPDNGAQR